MKPLTFKSQPLMYHHSRPLSQVGYGVVSQTRWEEKPEPVKPENVNQENKYNGNSEWHKYQEQLLWDKAYKHIEHEVGYHPMFMAVGQDPFCFITTGYTSNYSQETEEPEILFSYQKKPGQGSYQSITWWNIIFNEIWRTKDPYNVSNGYYKSAWKKSWTESKWLQYAQQDGVGDVQYIIPQLDLTQATCIWVPNIEAKEELIDKGFKSTKIRLKQRMNKDLVVF